MTVPDGEFQFSGRLHLPNLYELLSVRHVTVEFLVGTMCQTQLMGCFQSFSHICIMNEISNDAISDH